MKQSTETPLPPCIPLPKIGGDEVFGRSRSTWYAWEKKEFIKLRRFKIPGSKRATSVCIPRAEAAEFIRKREGFDLT